MTRELLALAESIGKSKVRRSTRHLSNKQLHNELVYSDRLTSTFIFILVRLCIRVLERSVLLLLLGIRITYTPREQFETRRRGSVA
jgi:hypothetical protein